MYRTFGVVRFLAASSIMALLQVSQAHCEPDAMSKLLANSPFQQSVVSSAKNSTVALREPCASSIYGLSQEYHPWVPVVFNEAGLPQSGAWTETVQETGCGKIRLLNVAIIVAGPNSVKMIPVLPGTTHAGPQLQKDSAPTVFAMALTKAKSCTDAYVSDTLFKAYGPATSASPRQPWNETWTIIACGQTILDEVRFIPDGTGTSYVAGLPN